MFVNISDNMLPKPHRLIHDQDFKRVFRLGESFYIGQLRVKILKNNLTISRFGFIVSNKISKRAVVRNKIKRRLREIVRQKLPVLKTGYDCVIITRSGVEDLNYQEMQDKLEQILLKLKLVKQ